MKTIKRLVLVLVLLTGFAFAADGGDRKVIHRVDPEYPEVAKRMQIHGTVKLKLWVDADGTVSRVEYINGHPMLSFPAITAAKKWKYESAEKESTETVELKF